MRNINNGTAKSEAEGTVPTVSPESQWIPSTMANKRLNGMTRNPKQFRHPMSATGWQLLGLEVDVAILLAGSVNRAIVGSIGEPKVVTA
jgi:hypothetical protein